MDFEIFVSVEEENSSRTDYTPLKEALRDQSYGLAGPTRSVNVCVFCVMCFVCYSASRVMKTFPDPPSCILNVLIFNVKKKTKKMYLLRKEHYLKQRKKSRAN